MFVKNPQRHLKIFQAPMINFANFLDCPAPTKALSFGVTVHEVACLYDTNCELVPFSTYSFSAEFLKKIGGDWDKDVITEDWRIYMKAYFETKGEARVAPLYLPIYCYAVVSNTYWQSLVERFHQAKRHSWGIFEVCYFMDRTIRTKKQEKPKSKIRTAKILGKIARIHIFAGLTFILMVYPLIFLILRNIDVDWMADNTCEYISIYSNIFNGLNAFQMVPIVWSLLSSFKIVKWCYPEMKFCRWVWEVIVILISSVFANFFYSFIPTFWAATRLIYSDKFRFIVAPKPSLSGEKIKTIEDRV